MINCSLCNRFYVGETSKNLQTRIKQHLYAIKKFTPFADNTNEVANHFRLKGHNYTHFKVCVFNKNLYDVNLRRGIEDNLIKFFNHFHNKCINVKIYNNTKLFCFN